MSNKKNCCYLKADWEKKKLFLYDFVGRNFWFYFMINIVINAAWCEDVKSFSITEHLMKFNTQKEKKKRPYFEHRTLIWPRFLLFFVNSLTLYLHLKSSNNLKDLAGTRGLKTKTRVNLTWKKVPSDKDWSLLYSIEVYPYLDQILFVNFSLRKSKVR